MARCAPAARSKRRSLAIVPTYAGMIFRDDADGPPISASLETERNRKVVIGYDGSESAQAAIRGLHRAGLPGDAEVLVASVADVSPPLPRESNAAAGAISRWHDSPIVKRAQALADESRAEAQTFAA